MQKYCKGRGTAYFFFSFNETFSTPKLKDTYGQGFKGFTPCSAVNSGTVFEV